jgi:hypothetical protein
LKILKRSFDRIKIGILACLLLIAAAPGLRAELADADLTQVRDQMRQYLLQPIPKTTEDSFVAPTGPQMEQWAASLQPNGAWSDIDYLDKSRDFWKTADHLHRIEAMAKYYDGERAAGKTDPAVRRAILLALDYWLQKDYRNPNWWENEIGVPTAVGNILVLMQTDLSPEELEQGAAIMSRAKIARTGQNKVWEAGIVLVRAALQKDFDTARKARNAIVGELTVTTGDGVQPDFSFHQHGPDLQIGNYGLAYAASFAQWAQVLRGTGLAIDEPHLSVLGDYLLSGVSPFLWKGALDISACGRQLFPESPRQKAEAFAMIFGTMPLVDPTHAEQYEAVIAGAESAADTASVPAANTHFWRSDIMVHSRPDYSLSVKMSSERVIGGESVNSENLSGYYLADGAAYLYRTGREYEDIFPVWDWRKVPGVTCPQAAGRLPRLGMDTYRPASSFVGGVSNGTYGAAALDLNRDGLTGKKSWFFFDNEVVCLGAGLHTDSDEDVTTSINQEWGHSDNAADEAANVFACPMGVPRWRWIRLPGGDDGHGGRAGAKRRLEERLCRRLCRQSDTGRFLALDRPWREAAGRSLQLHRRPHNFRTSTANLRRSPRGGCPQQHFQPPGGAKQRLADHDGGLLSVRPIGLCSEQKPRGRYAMPVDAHGDKGWHPYRRFRPDTAAENLADHARRHAETDKSAQRPKRRPERHPLKSLFTVGCAREVLRRRYDN